ncbi:AP-1 adaptor complex gamma subunit Apl4 [Schizosaccharomyces japonicus yFS275]|uniref:AP-1 complex subunit gamma n=1 Tax=Schizosaccharomyces japonicus (strain yFS275 / FY16936) TaxID=402676 RepID=B6JYY6_SCHJY|nr:AP-1 adaptor complex gamma subunit Apl4 [Schizosaccharomyces japonicus yFS275]EEB06754.1 AP-1 adaptor complex gamma subunit Apl4 [Schizosaccharomyces japonicus yFS275]
MSSLKSFIKAVRAAKTTAAETSAIRKESAAIRKSIRQDTNDLKTRRRNVAKLIYLYLLGEPTHFGQIECLKLVASPRFKDKRVGYLGAMLLLDENQEVLTLLTNSLQNDLKSTSEHVVGLALATFGSIASEELARDLSNDINELILRDKVSIRKKAILCAMKVCQKLPELTELYVDRVIQQFSVRSQTVLLTSLCFAIDVCERDPSHIEVFKKQYSYMLFRLKLLSTPGHADENNIGNIGNPFLQVKLLRFLAIMAKGDQALSDEMAEILTHICTATDTSRNAGDAVLYEAVRTILEIEASSGLRVLGVNILGKFLSNRDNNTRYVALNLLKRVVGVEEQAVQRHRTTVIECLYDADISIQKRALEFASYLVNDTNVRFMVKELLAFLEVAPVELKAKTTAELSQAISTFAPNRRWHFDTLLQVLKTAGNFASEDIVYHFLRLIASAQDLHEYAVFKLFAALNKDISQNALTIAAFWVIGEYGNMLLSPKLHIDDPDLPSHITAKGVIDLYEQVLRSTDPKNTTIIQFGLVALAKLTARFQTSTERQRIVRIISSFSAHLNADIQQRAIEFEVAIRDSGLDHVVFANMPAPPPPTSYISMNSDEQQKKHNRTKSEVQKTADLLDLIGLNDTTNNTPATVDNVMVGDASPSLSINTSVPTPSTDARKSHVNDILSLFDTASPSINSVNTGSEFASPALTPNTTYSTPFTTAASAAAEQTYAECPVYNKHDLSVVLVPAKDASSKTASITVLFRNLSSTVQIDRVQFEAAVPKSQKLRIQPLKSTTIPPSGEISQLLRVQGPEGARVRLRLRLGITRQGMPPILEQLDVSNLPLDLLS